MEDERHSASAKSGNNHMSFRHSYASSFSSTSSSPVILSSLADLSSMSRPCGEWGTRIGTARVGARHKLLHAMHARLPWRGSVLALQPTYLDDAPLSVLAGAGEGEDDVLGRAVAAVRDDAHADVGALCAVQHGMKQRFRDRAVARIINRRGPPHAHRHTGGSQHPVADVVAGRGGGGEGARQAAGLRANRAGAVRRSARRRAIPRLPARGDAHRPLPTLMIAAPRCCTVEMKSPSR